MRILALFAPLVAVACAAPALDLPPAGTPAVTISSGTGFSVLTSTTLYAGDILVTRAGGPYAAGPEFEIRQGRPGLYDAALALVLADGPALARGLDPDAVICLDYGEDRVHIDPPVDGFAEVSASCPDDRVQALQGRLRALWR